MSKKCKNLYLPEVIVFSPQKYLDNRGQFFENYNSNIFQKETGVKFNIIQENVSISNKNVLRGIHFQKGKFSQQKLINVLRGKILDVVVDLRPESKNFGKWISYILDDINNESIFIPYGFGHGFLSLIKDTKICYKVDKPYNKKAECSIIWNDKDILVDWKCKSPILSEKDYNSLTFEQNFKFNNFCF